MHGTANEGSTLTFDASKTTDSDLGRTDIDRSESLSCAWTFGEGSTAAGKTVQNDTFATYGASTATFRVTDAYGWERTLTQNVSIANVAPVVASIPGATLLQGDARSASGSFADPSVDPWTTSVSYEGTPELLSLVGKTFPLAHTYSTAGSYSVAVTVNDGDASGMTSANVVVQTPAQASTTCPALSPRSVVSSWLHLPRPRRRAATPRDRSTKARSNRSRRTRTQPAHRCSAATTVQRPTRWVHSSTS